MNSSSSPASAKPRILVVGGGFGGLAAVRELSSLDADIYLIDQRNHHVFQPLLYQVATAALSPADIAEPIRHILHEQQNCRVLMATVTGVDLKNRRLLFARASVEYDWLVLAAGATHSYFGRPEWAQIAPGLKSLEDAVELRRRILLAFECAEYEGNPEQRRAALTFAIVGGGPTGVELAGAIQEIAAKTIQEDFRNIDTTTTRVILIQGGDRLIPSFPPSLSERAKKDLEHMGVEVMLNSRVSDISRAGLSIGNDFLPVRNIFWAAGVQANPIGRTLGTPVDSSGRVIVGPDLSVPGEDRVFVIGDLAAASSARDGAAVPGVAQGALQMGQYVGAVIRREISGDTTSRKPFSYYDRGSMATIGQAHAVAHIGRLRLGGFIAWLLWGVVHVLALVSFRNRLSVAGSWIFHWVTAGRSARLITGQADLEVSMPVADPRVHLTEGPDSAQATSQK